MKIFVPINFGISFSNYTHIHTTFGVLIGIGITVNLYISLREVNIFVILSLL